ncbi:bone morphogenetic protein 1-like [Halichondria panicea]|uniref:bone morphogenetic protein 1-like n=1 Tax=Halichondria panicea TaxID=6063 RepID=UPI00312B47E2
MCGGLTLTLLSLAVGLLLCGQRTLCQLLPDLSDPCASSATQVHDIDVAYFPPSLLPQNESPSDSGGEDRKKRGATSENRKLWPNGVVYYTFSSRFNAAERRQILEAMKHWEDHTCIRFKHRSNQPHYVNFFPGAGCCSYVGRIDYGRQPQGVSIGRFCFNFHPIVHEISHVVGFWHEQSRPDRDEYIDIIEGNIVPGYETNFQKILSWRISSRSRLRLQQYHALRFQLFL